MSNEIKKFYYVYAHIHPITKQIFYIGKGVDDRAFKTSGRNKAWLDIVNSIKSIGLVYEVKILHICSSSDEAIDLEKIEIYLRIKSGQELTNIIQPNVNLEENDKSEDSIVLAESNEIGMFVRIKRKALNLTQVECAEKAGVGLRFLRELEQGHKKTLRADKINQVLYLFGAQLSVNK